MTPQEKAVLLECKAAVTSFLNMVNVIEHHQAVPIPQILEQARHNCPIVLDHIKTVLQEEDSNG